mgnify:CR=1 FL=1|jgi:hypothetical protein
MKILERRGAGLDKIGFAGDMGGGGEGATLYSNVRNMFFSSHP